MSRWSGAGDDGALTAAAERGVILGEATNQARALANEPGNLLTPRVFAEQARRWPRRRGWASTSSTRPASPS
jgi:leucyl aminopeptidase